MLPPPPLRLHYPDSVRECLALNLEADTDVDVDRPPRYKL